MLERSRLNHKHNLEFWKCFATQTSLETWGRVLDWRSCGESHLIKHGSAVQSTVSLSSGECENYALLRSSVHARGIKATLNDLHYGMKCEIHMRCDSSAARCMSGRQGLEKNLTR